MAYKIFAVLSIFLTFNFSAAALNDVEIETCKGIGSLKSLNIKVEFVNHLDCIHANCESAAAFIDDVEQIGADINILKSSSPDLGNNRELSILIKGFTEPIEGLFRCYRAIEDTHSR